MSVNIAQWRAGIEKFHSHIIIQKTKNSCSDLIIIFKCMLTFSCYVFLSIFLLQSGDIELNPRPQKIPHSYFSCCYWNVNSLATDNYSKALALKAYNSTYKYDFVCISETFLDSSFEPDNKGLMLDGNEIKIVITILHSLSWNSKSNIYLHISILSGILKNLIMMQLKKLLNLWIGILLSHKNVHEQVPIFNQTLMIIFSNYLPNKLITINDNDPPWMNEYIKRRIINKKAACKSFNTNNKSCDTYLKLQTINWTVRNDIKTKRWLSLSTLRQTQQSKDDCKSILVYFKNSL